MTIRGMVARKVSMATAPSAATDTSNPADSKVRRKARCTAKSSSITRILSIARFHTTPELQLTTHRTGSQWHVDNSVTSCASDWATLAQLCHQTLTMCLPNQDNCSFAPG